jgi:D-xylonolactonase
MKTPKIIADYHCHNAEVPTWHPMEKCLYWSDIPTGRVFRYDPATAFHEQIFEGDSVGAIAVHEDGSLLFFMNKGAIARWQNGTLTPIIPEIPAERETRFNDCIVDPAGRVFSGTMQQGDRLGSLYRLNTDGTLTQVLEHLQIPNGMGFTLDRKHLYLTDSPKREIYSFDYDVSTGDISNRQVVITTPEGEGVPDGMTVDAEGYIWSARWNGRYLFRYSPDGTEVLRIPFPAKKVSALTFGGEDYTDIYATTAGGDNRSQEGKGAGAVFHLNLGIRGMPEFLAKIAL